ncbi:hypothetical protein EUBDOL_02172 [Amedibacillus dolichus DSM 3991]|uniref:Uncharacterized protein n=1 Tax=Amedibacillus dolichus DSM 3991 TaxID=428127 RepID=A8RF80_9FIRM|nr:hypothetical protein EUBDOL_02172 [Amedibacillus dolichus DSM 3991]
MKFKKCYQQIAKKNDIMIKNLKDMEDIYVER